MSFSTASTVELTGPVPRYTFQVNVTLPESMIWSKNTDGTTSAFRKKWLFKALLFNVAYVVFWIVEKALNVFLRKTGFSILPKSTEEFLFVNTLSRMVKID